MTPLDLDDIESRINDGIYGDDRMSDTARDDAFSALAVLLAEVERLRVERAEWARLLVEAKKEGARSTVAEVAAERAAVVTWIRRVATDARDWSEHADVYDAIADNIESGEHRREGDE